MIWWVTSLSGIGTFAIASLINVLALPTPAGSPRSASADIAFASRRDGNWEIYDGSYTWSVDGTQVAFISARDGVEGVYSVDADGQHAARLTTTASLTPAWGSQR